MRQPQPRPREPAHACGLHLLVLLPHAASQLCSGLELLPQLRHLELQLLHPCLGGQVAAALQAWQHQQVRSVGCNTFTTPFLIGPAQGLVMLGGDCKCNMDACSTADTCRLSARLVLEVEPACLHTSRQVSSSQFRQSSPWPAGGARRVPAHQPMPAAHGSLRLPAPAGMVSRLRGIFLWVSSYGLPHCCIKHPCTCPPFLDA